MTRLSWCFFLAFAGCGDKEGEPAGDSAADESPPPEDSAPPAGADADGDGHPDAEDCHDGDPAIYPGAPEVCDDADNDCDLAIDEDALDAPTWHPDSDGDGYGVDAIALAACDAPEGRVAQGGDCDDADPGINPDSVEYCDEVDNDCDGATDEGSAADAPAWYADADGDTYGDEGAPASACERPAGYTDDTADCDDTDPQTRPGASEHCDGEDDDCDGSIDEDPADGLLLHPDADGDGYGDESGPVELCVAPAGYVAEAGDCDDAEPAIHPGVGELCDDVDQDCDGKIDDNPLDPTAWYPDGDGDGYGQAPASKEACDQPAGFVSNNDDCDDTDASNNPLAEICTCGDGSDNDSDGLVDCEDGDCATDAACYEARCADEKDGDNDGLADCDDEDCWGRGGCAEILTWVEAGSFEGSAFFRAFSFSDTRFHSGQGSSRWSRARSVQGGISRHSTHGFSTTCTWTLASAYWRGTWAEGYEGLPAIHNTHTDFSLDPVARVGLALSPDCAIDLPLEEYLPRYVGLGTRWAPEWGEAGYNNGPSGFWTAWWAPGWYVPGSWNSARVASTAYDPGTSTDSDLWLSTWRDTWTGALIRGDSYYTDPPW